MSDSYYEAEVEHDDPCNCDSFNCMLPRASAPVPPLSNFEKVSIPGLKDNRSVYNLRSYEEDLFLKVERLHGGLIGTSITLGAYGYGYICGVQLLPRRVTDTPLSDEEILAMIDEAKVSRKKILIDLKKYDDDLKL